MRPDVLFWLLFTSCVSLFGLFISAYLVNKAQKAGDQRKARLLSVSHPKKPARTVHISAFTPTRRSRSRSLTSTGAMIFGLDLQQVGHYRLPWWIVLPATLGAAKLAQLAAHGLVGNASYLALLAAWVILSRQVFGWMEKRRKRKAVVQLPDILDQIVRAVRVGMPVLEALRVATRDAPEPSRTEFVKLVDQVSFGTPLEDAVAAMAQRCNLPEYSFFATALSLQNQTGGALGETLLNLADVVRKRVAIAEKGKALSSEAKATAIVLTALPFMAGLILWIMNPHYMGLLFDEPLGHKMLAAAGISLGLGLLTIRMMFQRALSLT
ncbi:MAG: hypothetical protein B7Z80_26595 [Rhodospirillales bacterium 20-64-7]|nr:MAG: hypothetical protein B7Z80_26595 [Rhodospirillales bacterium 20-64-7]HQT79492.1 type II secretion system F family protein [Rhodopila sp.]